MEKVVCILGPTGVGKSKMAIALAHKFDGEILSADAVQVFKGFDIGSAKATEEEKEGIRHHFIDICEANDYFSVSDFVTLAKDKITSLNKNKKLPIVVGGTGLYINALINGYNFGETSKHEEFREKCSKDIDNDGCEQAWNKLNSIAPEIAQKIEKTDKRRIIRGLEIATFGGKKQAQAQGYNYKIYALTMDREKLYQKINVRTDQMFEKGLINEVKGLLTGGASVDSQPMKSIGYKEVIEYLNGIRDYQETVNLVKQHTRNYAKRQMTYLRGLAKKCEVQFVELSDFKTAEKNIEDEIRIWNNEN